MTSSFYENLTKSSLIMCYFCCASISKSDSEPLKDCKGRSVSSTSFICKSCIKKNNHTSLCLAHAGWISNNRNDLLVVNLHSGGYRYICKAGAQEIFCADCGVQSKVRSELSKFNQENGGKDFALYNRKYYCQGCYSALAKKVGDYALAPPGIPQEDSLGVEVELAWKNEFKGADKRQDVVSKIFDLKQIIVKKDGSIGDGYEFVSSPINLSKQKILWHKVVPYFKEYFQVTPKCGMHVHISRDSLKLSEMYKLMLLAHNPDNTNLLTKIGGRPLNNYCVVRGKERVDDLFVKRLPVGKLLVPKEKIPTSQHYDILSLSPRHPTLEFRWFSSSTEEEDILGNIEIVCALKEYSGKISLKEPTVDKFLKHFKTSDLSDKYNLALKKLTKLGVIN